MCISSKSRRKSAVKQKRGWNIILKFCLIQDTVTPLSRMLIKWGLI